MQNETELVIALSPTPLRPAAYERVTALLSGTIDWALFRDRASRWQVEPTVYRNLRTGFRDLVSANVLDELALKEREARAYALTGTLRLADLTSTIEAAGIPVIVLKGPAVASAAYGDYSSRRFADVDFLVRRSDLPAARDFLLARGLVRDFAPAMERALIADQHALEFSDRRSKVELHWSLLSRHLCLDLDPAELWADARHLDCVGYDIKVLSTEHLFLFLCAHGAKHEWMLFRWILDIAQLTRRIDAATAGRVMALAERSNAKRILALALRIARDTFGDEESPFPAEAMLAEGDTRTLAGLVAARLDPDSVPHHELVGPRLARIHPYLGPLAFWIRSRERRRDQLATAARFFFIPAASDVTGGALHGALRPFRLVVHALRRISHSP